MELLVFLSNRLLVVGKGASPAFAPSVVSVALLLLLLLLLLRGDWFREVVVGKSSSEILDCDLTLRWSSLKLGDPTDL